MKTTTMQIKYKVFSIFFLMLWSQAVLSQTFTDSNLPIVVITTDTNSNGDALPILDDPRVLATMKIIRRPDGSRNYVSDIDQPSFLNYNGRINIEVRGSTSQYSPKKQYGLTTLLANNTSNNNVGLLGMPSENDWILNGFAFDASLMRDYISYNTSRQIGQYAVRTVYCEVVINGEYQGLYLLSEKIKPDGNRVNIVKMTTSDTLQPNVTGGYITKTDKTGSASDPVAWSMSSYNQSADFIHDSPNPAVITKTQSAYIESVFRTLETTAHASDTSLAKGYPSVIDIPTFIDYMLLAEIASNVDAYEYSTFFHKDRNGKLRAGPIWDYNFSYGNDPFFGDRSRTDVWQFDNEDNTGPKFWKDLFDNEVFKCYVSRRFNQLTQTGQPLNYTSMSDFIDATTSLISEAIVRENARWSTVSNHPKQIIALKMWIQQRMHWMADNLGSYSDCNAIVTPSLVITKIHYNPATSTSFPVSNNLEFIELQNTGATTIDLTGIYFSELGLSYQFPSHSTLPAGEKIYIASNQDVFLSKYGFPASGQFTRNLSNSNQNLVLADGFGNTIDVVNYSDHAPWPTAADGQGSWLELVDPALDNSVASNWVASSSSVLSTLKYAEVSNLSIYPNPASNEVYISASSAIQKVGIIDVLGKQLIEQDVDATSTNIDISNLKNGLYFFKISFDGGIQVKQLIKN